MKNRTLLLMAFIAVLAVTVISCTPAGEISDANYPNRPVYNSSPYGNNVIVVERDPYTGRYYQVNPNSVYLNDPYYNNNYPYYNGNVYGNRGGYYNRGYSGRRYDNRVYSNTNTYPNTNTNSNSNVNRQPSEEERQRAKEKVFGRRN